ncbi:MAG: galactose-1-phosphate uridylyltransferase [Kineosporiaceae bacterium]
MTRGRHAVQLADGRDLIYFDDTEPWASAPGPRPGADTRPLPPAVGGARMRRDPLTGEWVPMASHRMDRTFLPPREVCPLCPTRSGLPSEIPAADYDVVVFENRFPALTRRDPGRAVAVDGEALWPERPAAGRCEVVCFTSDHDASFSALPPHRVRTVVEAWADRTAELSALDGVAQVFCFENRGREIGVTLSHPHGQIYAYPYPAPRTAQHVARAAEHHAATGRDLLGDVLAAECRSGRRVLWTGAHWTAFVPAAARWPVELHLVPHRHVLDVAGLDDAEREEMSTAYPRLLRALDRFFVAPPADDPGGPAAPVTLPYIAGWFAAPLAGRETPDRLPRLHLQVFSILRAPGKLKYLAGSESAAGAWISDTTPERIADRLREVLEVTP